MMIELGEPEFCPNPPMRAEGRTTSPQIPSGDSYATLSRRIPSLGVRRGASQPDEGRDSPVVLSVRCVFQSCRLYFDMERLVTMLNEGR